jgi:succinate dehydrogenase/fumarate reductase cytochrome b subunit
MRQRTAHSVLLKIARLSGWLLLPLMVQYILTGFSLCGELGFQKVVSAPQALIIHQMFEWPLIVAFLLHSIITIYFAMRRWGWITNRPYPNAGMNRPETPVQTIRGKP